MRLATPEDMPTLIDYARRFFDESGYGAWVTFSPESVKTTFENMIESPDAEIFIAEEGLAGVLAQSMYMTRDITAHEIFWWVAPEYRQSGLGGVLKDALEDWARDKGAVALSFSTLDAATPESVEHTYRTDGCIPTERGFLKRL